MKKIKNILITGANRGLGLGFVTHYLNQDNYNIIACCRNPSMANDLNLLSKNIPSKNTSLNIVKLDITDKKDRSSLFQKIHKHALDIIILNAGIYGERNEQFGKLSDENLLEVINTNAISQILLAQDLWPCLERGSDKLMVVISSKMGSIADNKKGGSYAYRASKAALNALMKSLAIDLFDKGLTLKLIHPGWVQTRMGGEHGLLTVQDSISGIVSVMDSADFRLNTGAFVDYLGKEVPW